MNPANIFHMQHLLTKNFADDIPSDTYRLLPVKKEDVENHWFIKNGEFKVKLLCKNKVRYYYYTDDRNHALYGKSALYFRIQKNDQEPIPVFLGLDTSSDSNGVGVFLGGNYPSSKMGRKFDYGEFAQKFYNKINGARLVLKDYQDFAPWLKSNLKDILTECLTGSDIDYPDMKHLKIYDFVHFRGIESLDFQAGLYESGKGKMWLDNDILLELIGYRLFAADKNLYRFVFDHDFVCKACEKAFDYITGSEFGSVDQVPRKGINDDGIEIFNPRPHETIQLGAGAQSVEHIRLDGLPKAWDEQFFNKPVKE